MVPRYFQWKGGLDGWRIIATDDTGTDLWTVPWAWEELEGGGVYPYAGPHGSHLSEDLRP